MPISNYPGGFADGVNILGLPVLNTYGGNVFWVNSSGGSNGNKGTRERPFATLDYAIGRCTANNGDIIMVMENHAETITGAGGITADVAGITIVGLGSYNQRPRFLMDGGTAVTFLISAADVTVSNLVFASGHADVVTCFNVTAVGAHIDRCEFVDNVTDENFLTEIKATGTTNNEADGLKVTNCRAYTVDANAVEFIELNADIRALVVQNNFVSKDAATGGKFILQATGKDLQDCLITDNMHTCGNTSGDIFIDNDTTANWGIVARNLVGHHDTAAVIIVDADGVRQFLNYAVGSDTESGVLMPAADTLT